MSKYNEIMEHIELTDEMRERIIGNVSAKQKRRRFSRMISAVVAAAACIAIVFASVAVLKNTGKLSKTDNPIVDATAPTVDTAGTYGGTMYRSAAELSENFGIEICELTKLPFDVSTVSYSIMFDSFAEIDYCGDDGEECCFRIGKDTEDISGEYDEFTTVETETVNGCEVTLKGYDYSYRIASWVKDGHFYSVSLSSGTDKDIILEIAGEVISG
ncbi:MAG: hypothetical protein IKO47_13040 [Ruminococcus sp.]|nr:hypothetical protein [Ruminococcus sp.]